MGLFEERFPTLHHLRTREAIVDSNGMPLNIELLPRNYKIESDTDNSKKLWTKKNPFLSETQSNLLFRK